MFGYITTNSKELSAEEKARYSVFYCGLCKTLGDRYGAVGSACLTYDMTFLALFLNSLYALEEEPSEKRCAPQPLKKHPCVGNSAVDYAADLNIILSYYQAMDDWHDDHSLVAREKARKLEECLKIAKERCPRQFDVIAQDLILLGEMERSNELNPDLPANRFGHLMGELFAWREDDYAAQLRRMGAALGRYIYLLDARNDLREDIRKQRYNPLIAQIDTDFLPILTLMIGECTAVFETLPLQRDIGILRNILYSGVWMNYRIQKDRGGKDDG